MRGRSGAGSSQVSFIRSAAGIILAALTFSFVSFVSTSWANPSGGTVSSGSASIVTSGNLLDINQSTQRAVIDWRSFNIAPTETTKFNQPSSSSVTLNRINDPDPSQILGTLTANGNVILINPNGVFFGPGSQVDVNGLIATTANIKNSDFMAGNMNFGIPGNPDASIVNEGTITAKDAGMVGLVAPNVINSGTINTKLGHTDLGSGDTFTMDMYGDGLIEVGVSDAVKKQVIENSGTINAAGGTIQVTAAAGRQVVDSLVAIAGKLNAPTAQQKNGRIIISAAGSNAVANNVAADKGVKTGTSTVLVSGTLDASGYGAGQTGGSISVLGDNVGILSGAKIDASGSTGGGTIRIGGDFHGKGTTPTALHTVVQNDTAITADAISTGNGGTVAVWADDSTAFDGNIEARGGPQSGNGGYVETSGHNTLSLSGTVDASAPNGDAGTWLMDPNNVTITNTATTNTGSAPNFSDTGSPANVDTTDIQTALNGGTSVNVTASGSIAVNNNITENTYNGTESLTLAAGTDITLAASTAITASGSTKLNVILDADTAGAGGGIVLNAGSSISSNGGNITMGGNEATPSNIIAGTGYAVGDTATLGIGIAIDTATVNAAGGNIIMNGQGYAARTGSANFGVIIGNGGMGLVETSGTGTVSLNGIGGGTGSGTTNDFGVYLSNTSTKVTAVNGLISLTGTGGDTSSIGGSNVGIDLGSGVEVLSTGNGGISLTGTGGNSSGGTNYGINGNANNGIISTGSSPITITGISGAGSGSTGINLTTVPVGGASDTGAITLNADTLNYSGSTIKTTGTVTFAPYTASTTIGFSGGAGTLAITQAIMDNVNAPTVILGRPDSTGGLYTGAFTWETTLNNLYLEGGADFIAGNITKSSGINNATLSVISGTNITQQSGDTISSSGTFGRLNTVFDADTAGAGGAISVQANITRNGGYINLGGGALSGGLPTGAAVGASVGGTGLSTSAGTILNAGGGNITMNGQGYSTGGRGVDIFGTLQTSATGTISLTGAAGGTGGAGNDYGVVLENASALTSATGAIILNGTGASVNTALANTGIRANGETITSTGGAITLNGNGGAAPGSGMGISAGTIQNSGTGTISLIGTTSSGNSTGISLSGGTIATTGTGLIGITGTGTGPSVGISITGGSIAPTGAAPITLTGMAGSSQIFGININPASVANVITSAGGTVTLISPTTIYLKNTGITYSGGASYGLVFDADTALAGGEVYLDTGDTLSTNGGNITLGGGALSGGLPAGAAVGLSTVGNEYGISIAAGDTVNAAGGNIAMTGTGGTYATGTDYGINDSATIQTSGSGTISLTGTGGIAAGNSDYGIYASGVGITQTSGTGSITLTGIGGGTGASTTDYGIYVTGTVKSTAATSGGGITLIGYGGDMGGTGASNYGSITSGTVSSVGGNIVIDGNTGISGQAISNTTGNGNHGTYVTGSVSSTGIANITINGFGGGSGASASDTGVLVTGTIQSSGTGTINIAGTGGITASNDHGASFNNSTITSQTGTINITGTAGVNGVSAAGIQFFANDSILSTGSAAMNMTGIGGQWGIFTNGTGTQIIGGGSDTGNITFTTNIVGYGVAAGIQTTGTVTFAPYTASTTVGVAGGAGTLGVTSAILNNVTAGGIIIGSTADTGAMTVNGYNWTAPLTLLNGGGNIAINGAEAMGANSLLAETLSGNIALGASGSVTSSASGTPITLVAKAGNFTDSNASATALSAPSGRWLVYSTNPASDNDGALVNSFRRFSCTYGGSCPSYPAAGNGFLYTTTPVLTATPGPLSVTYGSAAPSLTGYGYTLSGYLGGDGAADALSGALNGTTAYTSASNVGSYNINYASGALASAMGYGFSYANNPAAFTVTPKALTVTANSFGKTYGNTYSFLGNEFTDAGLVNGDTVSGLTFSSPGAAPTATVAGGPYAISGSAATGTGLGNYTITYNNGQLTVNPAALTITANSFGKTYGTTYSFLGNEFTDTGLVNGNTVTGLTLSSAGAPATATVTGGPYAITGSGAVGTGLSNYTVTYVDGQLTVNPAALTITANSFGKTYGTSYNFLGNEFTDTGLVNGNTVTGLTLSSPGAAGTATVAGGPYYYCVINGANDRKDKREAGG